ncbi:hypothetical protein JAO73_22750 [Hymenobacter sp. BT523]|uniref:alpha-2-macroglobulin family protein n=1 Tax=Hymenobacter sp. BT523 TaxID=2795725 RepID=UPI0018EC34F4|nr:MG2 domain-containing protein [Hymenobacter sp. BT523]MBJ6111857.1 hypothetical protein [Hymenobacter sp. BT523]
MRLSLLFLLLFAAILSADSAAPTPPGPYAARWKKIDGLLAKGQTATAAPLVQALYAQAKKEGNSPQYVRALLYKVRLLQAKEEDDVEKSIALLEAEARTATFPARPILHSLLAELYTQYLNQNRYRLYQRTAGAAPSTGPDASASADAGTGLATWDMGRLGAAIVRHYYQSVEDEPQRQLKTTLAQLGDLAAGGDAEGRALRPTLYDLLAQRAIEGLKNQELYITRPEQQFQPTEPGLFGTAAEFAALRLLAPDGDSLNGTLHALHLLQRLTASRQQLAPQNPAALADVDLSRLDYLHGLTQNTGLAAQYVPALVRMADTYKALPISTEFMARRAEAAREAGDNVTAVRLAREAEARFPKSRGAARARALRSDLERPELTFSAAGIVVPNQPWRLDVTARNVTKLYAWAYRISLKQWQQSYEYDPLQRSFGQRYARALKEAPVATWAMAVAAPPDYKEQKLAVAGAAVPAGYYLVVVSNQATRPTEEKPGAVTSYALLGASELSAVNQRDATTGALRLLLMHRQTGAPLAGLPVQATTRVYEAAPPKDFTITSEVLQTDANGIVTLPLPATAKGRTERMLWTRAWRGPDTLQLNGGGSYYRPGTPSAPVAQRRVFLFTDRAIYRPGQTVYFKGILTESLGAKARLLAKQPLVVGLMDVNGQPVQTLPFTTSDYGSFNGSLVLPTGLLNGQMMLRTEYGNTSFAVEDYKRPTFLVTLDSVPGRPQLGQPLTLGGRARAYAGQATDGAAVSYRVTRRELFPLFDLVYGSRGGYLPGGSRGAQEIAHGRTLTDGEGRFSITFTPPLVPPAQGRRGWEPGYLFEIAADVTDAAGETRTGTRAFPIGRNPISLQLTGPNMADKQRLPAVTLLATNATGEPAPATGTLRLRTLRYRPNPPGVPGPVPETAENETKSAVLKTAPFDTNAGAQLALGALVAEVPTGRYRLEAVAAGADSARAQLDFTLYDSQAATVPFATPDWFVTLADTVAPGQPATVLVGGGAAGGHLLLEVDRDGQLLRQEWLTLNANEQRRLTLPSGPATANGPLFIHTTQTRDNVVYRHDATVQVTEKPQPLQLSIATFRNKLQPGQQETWRVTIRQANGKAADAELLATLYDQSLDIFRPHHFTGLAFWDGYHQTRFGWQVFYQLLNAVPLFVPTDTGRDYFIEYPMLRTHADYFSEAGRTQRGSGLHTVVEEVVENKTYTAAAMPAPMAADRAMSGNAGGVVNSQRIMIRGSASMPPAPAPAAPDLSTVPTRSDFRETALWQPALHTDKNGDVVLEFQMPEAVTRWQLLALAHDKNLHSGQLARQLVTQKEIQITPNAPRFFRQGDTFTFPAKFSNLTDHATSGTAQLFLLDAATGQDLTTQLLKGPAQQPVSAAAHQSAAVGWEISLPADFAPAAVTYRVVVSSSLPVIEEEKRKKSKRKKGVTTDPQQLTTSFSDGEENSVPVLPNRILVTESLPLPMVGPSTRTFELQKLTSTSSPTRRNYSLTLEMTANPAWYAVQSLPYLMEYPYECSEQVFSRLYANLLAAQIIRSNPRFKTVLAEWTRQAQSGTAAQRNALDSKLAQNQELKNLLLQETPWVRDAQSETERLVRLTELFDETRLKAETSRALLKLQKMQLPDGAFPWFEQMPADRYITQLIVAGFGKLRKLGAFDASTDPTARALLQSALRYLDAATARDYAELRRQKGVKLAENHLGDLQIQALYARSFWRQLPIATGAKDAYSYYHEQAAKHWPAQTRYLQALIALSLTREKAGGPAPREIMRALAENALHSPELGMYWKEVRGGYYWREAPTETQATLIEAFDEINHDQQSVDELKLWLLKQKQTHSWESTRATADACYALLLRGSDWLAPAQPLQVTVGGQALKPEAAQAGTGYFKTSWPAAEVQPAQGKVTVAKPDAGVAWGALYWQYFEDLDKVTPAATPLSLERQLYREVSSAGGPQLEKLTAAAPLAVGDVLVVRLVMRTDRELEYVHLKDQRAAGLEPVGQLSGYRYQNGLGYYESPRDAATNFFLGAVPRGTHVFEYRLRVSQAGDFSGGHSQVQCLYAPEFSAHSAGMRVQVAPQSVNRAK